MHALYPVADIRSIEGTALAQTVPGALMQRAGAAAADIALRLLSGSGQPAEVLVLAGPGNNGGDALVTARCLAQEGIRVTVLLCATPTTADAAAALLRTREGSARIIESDRLPSSLTHCGLVIDGLFGIGLTRPIGGALGELIAAINRMTCMVLALDVPSGLDADTGNVVGEDGIAIQATHTITFIGDKPGLHTAAGRDLAGRVEVADLEIGRTLFPQARMHLNEPERFAASLRPRAHNTHKGSYGDVAVIGGAPGMAGAPVLAARAAAQCGAGRVFVAFAGPVPAYDSAHPELMFRPAQELDLGGRTIVIGPGLGISDAARALLRTVLASDRPAVLDADALNLVASDPAVCDALAGRPGATLITPHPLEAARLNGTTVGAIQADRVGAARALARRFNCIAILKGSGTVIAAADGETAINTTGNPALATAGTGDVLAGMCGALLAQRWPAWEAALGAVWLHGRAADTLVAQGIGPIGLTASELIPAIRIELNRLASAGSNAALA
jgi:ADP-dependent NAD(P)H-hydrate dehydratase / NAD(P)H-hydrate epimerase